MVLGLFFLSKHASKIPHVQALKMTPCFARSELQRLSVEEMGGFCRYWDILIRVALITDCIQNSLNLHRSLQYKGRKKKKVLRIQNVIQAILILLPYDLADCAQRRFLVTCNADSGRPSTDSNRPAPQRSPPNFAAFRPPPLCRSGMAGMADDDDEICLEPSSASNVSNTTNSSSSPFDSVAEKLEALERESFVSEVQRDWATFVRDIVIEWLFSSGSVKETMGPNVSLPTPPQTHIPRGQVLRTPNFAA